MHSQIAQSEALSRPQPRGFQRRKCRRRNDSRYSKKRKDQHGMDSNLEGTAEGLGLDDLLDDLLSNEIAINDPATENSKNSSIQQNMSTMAEFLMKIDEDVASNVDFPDFMICLQGEQKTIGRFSFPLSLVPTVERITNIYGDVSAASLMNPIVTGQIYLFFCATIKEMEDLKLDQVTEKILLKWRDAIKDALRINFKVDFAMNHLKKIARAYFGRVGSQVIQTIDDKLNALYKERTEAYEGFKDSLADAKDFYGKSVSSGLFP